MKNNSVLIWSLPIGGLFYTAGVLLRGPFANPLGPPAEFVARAGASVFPVAYLLIMVASGLALVGYVGLRDQLGHRLGQVAMALSMVGLSVLTAFFGVMAIVYPVLAGAHTAGDPAAVALAAQAMQSPPALAVLGLVSLSLVGHVLFAIGLWRTGWMPKPAAVLFVAAPVMQMITLVYPVEILGCVLLAVSGFWFAVAVGQKRRSHPETAPAALELSLARSSAG
jgi:hypothetical protein